MKKELTNKRKVRIITILIVLVMLFLSYNIFFKKDNNSSYALSKYGSNSNEVKQIQTKLKRWGYYKGNVDGIYGSQTLSAVKLFQSKNGLTVDRNFRTKNSRGNGNIFF